MMTSLSPPAKMVDAPPPADEKFDTRYCDDDDESFVESMMVVMMMTMI